MIVSLSIPKSTNIVDALRSKLIATQTVVRKEINVSQLAGSLRTSSTPVREALFQLVGEELVELVPQKGFFLRPINLQSTKSCFAVIQSIIEYRMRRASSNLIYNRDAIEKLGRISSSVSDSTNRSYLLKEFYLFIFSDKIDVEEKLIISKLYLKIELVLSKILSDNNVWSMVIREVGRTIQFVERGDFESAIATVEKLYVHKNDWIDQAFRSFAIEYFAED